MKIRTVKALGWLFLLPVLCLGCSRGNSGPASNTVIGKNYPSAYLEGFRLVETVKGRTTWEFQADNAMVYETKNKAYAERVRIYGYNAGRLVSYLTADKGTVQTQTNEAEVEGHVVLMGQQKTKLETQTLQWDPRNKKITTDDFVKVTYGDGNVLTGFGLVASANLDHLQIMDPRGRIKDITQVQRIKQ